ncbi:MAG: glycosyltransferase family 2 protein [Kiritimatiellaeota bacterium]|nr:glycosyltransferase family 2 protein [Kiritimatiellota bacterium]
MNTSLSIVIPVYKEATRLPVSLESIWAFVQHLAGLTAEVIFVDDGSPDDSMAVIAAFAEKNQIRSFRQISYTPNRGKGYAVKTGILAATGDLVLMSDTDLSTPLDDFSKLKTAIDAGADIACGSRAVAGAHIGVKPPLRRRLSSRVFNLLVRMAGVRGIRDTQCGFKLFRTSAAKHVFASLRTERFAFDVEIIAKARKLGYTLVEVPVNWNYNDNSTVRLLSSGSRMLFDIILIAFHRLLKRNT